MQSIKSPILLASAVLVGLLALAPTTSIWATGNPGKQRSLDEKKLKQYEQGIDSLILSWSQNRSLDTTNLAIDFLGDEGPIQSDIPDSVFIKRLAKIPSLIDLPYNNVVRASILWYIIRRKNVSEKIVGLKDYYFPIFEQTLDKYDLPIELRYLPIIESALNPVAVSRVGATGLWQFMYGTGKQYNLNISSFVDERRDPVASSEAAAKFLKDLYRIYQDWTLVIAAYNCGPRNVNKAIRRAGGSKNYWAIYNYLPKETRGYVPNFIAAAYMINYYKEHNITPQSIEYPKATDTIHVNRMLHFQQIADVLPISVDELRSLNPQYKKDVIPGIEKSYSLVLPLGNASQYIANEPKIYASDSVYFTQNNFPALMASNGKYEMKSKTIHHKVRRGETLATIAKKFDVDVSSIKDWNRGKIRHNKLVAGQVIKIQQSTPVAVARPAANLASANPKPTTTDTSKDVIIVEEYNSVPEDSAVAVEATPAPSKSSGKVIYYHVKKNDSLWKIAQKFEGITAQDIKEANNITSTRNLKVGQKLKIVIN